MQCLGCGSRQIQTPPDEPAFCDSCLWRAGEGLEIGGWVVDRISGYVGRLTRVLPDGGGLVETDEEHMFLPLEVLIPILD